tara:strand:+ start:436 stop:567 length:132 start_codon:yes stop_codon:yes gene_type:complete
MGKAKKVAQFLILCRNSEYTAAFEYRTLEIEDMGALLERVNSR